MGDMAKMKYGRICLGVLAAAVIVINLGGIADAGVNVSYVNTLAAQSSASLLSPSTWPWHQIKGYILECVVFIFLMLSYSSGGMRTVYHSATANQYDGKGSFIGYTNYVVPESIFVEPPTSGDEIIASIVIFTVAYIGIRCALQCAGLDINWLYSYPFD